jgi:hypothetical protein
MGDPVKNKFKCFAFFTYFEGCFFDTIDEAVNSYRSRHPGEWTARESRS